MSSQTPLVRSLWWSTTVTGPVDVDGVRSPFDTAHLKIHYPAVSDDSIATRLTGVMEADKANGPYPVVVFLNGINVSQDAYRWLMIRLVEAGCIAVSYDYVGPLMPGLVGITPGLDIDAVRPGTYGTRPAAYALPQILAALDELQAEGPLAGALDLTRVAIGGHSGGGTAALQTARTSYVPGLLAVFTYAAHAVPASMLGWPEGTVLEVASDVPALVMYGTEDGVIAGSTAAYDEDRELLPDPVRRTFDEGVPGGRDDSYLVEFKGANHFAIGDNEDPTAARGFLDGVAEVPVEQTRETLGALVCDFVRTHLLHDVDAAERIDDTYASPPPTIATFLRK